MQIVQELSEMFNPVAAHVKNTFHSVRASGAAVLLIHNDKVVTEAYWGTHADDPQSRKIQEDTQFHVASVRKSYIGYAVAHAVYNGAIKSIDDEVTKYLPSLDKNLLHGTTIRHLLTHSHGLAMNEGGVYREFAPGQKWAYRGVGVNMLTEIIRSSTGQTIAEIVYDQVFQPLGFKETGWYGIPNHKLVEVIREEGQRHWITSNSTDGAKMNMYVSARELAYWGNFHLQLGRINNVQVVSPEIIELATTLQSPSFKDADNPQNGFLWFVKDLPAKRSEIGERVPPGSYQILGYTGVALLVIPKHNLVAARMFNSFGSPQGFDYLEDIRDFGDTIMKCLEKNPLIK